MIQYIKKLRIIYLMFLFALTGCAVTDIDRTVNFSAYKTFDWGEAEIKVDNPVYESGLIDKNIRRTVEQEFAKRGIIHDERDPDFVVNYTTYTEKEKRVSRNAYAGYPFYPRFYPYYYGWGWWGWMPFPDMTPQPYEYTEGTLIIDITDAKSDELLWRGTVSGKVDDVGKLQKQIAKGVRAIMKKYPLTPGSSPLFPSEPARV